MKEKSLVQKGILDLKPYIPGKPIEEVKRELGLKEVIKLASNETSVGPSPLAVEAIKKEVENINLYPEGSSRVLREKIAHKLNLDKEMIIIGNGADNIINLIGMAFINEGDEVVTGEITFPAYETITKIMGGKLISVKLKNYRFDLEEIAQRINEKTKIIFLCNPNNPTGSEVPRDKIIDILQRAKGMVIVDECNYEYLGKTVIDLIDKYPNLIISRSFSKSFGLAGLRFGFAISNSQNIKRLATFGQYFRVNRMAEKAVEKVLKYLDYYQKSWGKIKKVRDKFVKQINELGFFAYNSKSNFVLVEFKNKKETEKVWEYLKKNNIYTLPGWEKNEFSGLEDQFIRFTIGKEWEMDRVAEVLAKY